MARNSFVVEVTFNISAPNMKTKPLVWLQVIDGNVTKNELL